MKFFKIFGKKNTPEASLTLEKLVEKDLISKEEMLFLKKERAIKEWQNEVRTSGRKKPV